MEALNKSESCHGARVVLGKTHRESTPKSHTSLTGSMSACSKLPYDDVIACIQGCAFPVLFALEQERCIELSTGDSALNWMEV